MFISRRYIVLFAIILLGWCWIIYSLIALGQDLRAINTDIQNLTADIQNQRTLNNRNYEYLIKMEQEFQLKSQSTSAITPNRGSSNGIEFKATAYTYTGNRTASGTIARPGVIAVDPKVIPLGSVVVVNCREYPSVNGVYIAQDTGGAIKGNIIDIYMNSYDDCIEFGRKSVTITYP